MYSIHMTICNDHNDCLCINAFQLNKFHFSLHFQIVDYFSYEHFYVIYCKFWELDSDHDLLIDEKELLKHGNHGMFIFELHSAESVGFIGARNPR